MKRYLLAADESNCCTTSELLEGQIDMLVVDGPPGFSGKRARYPAIPLLNERPAPGASVFIDDANREDERAMVERWLAEYPEFRTERLGAEKGCVRLIKELK